MKEFTIKCLRENPSYFHQAAQWFSEKWGIPKELYLESIQRCGKKEEAIPQWYLVVHEKGELIGGAGVIENDFHDRKDCTPNLCALYVEEKWRKKGAAKKLLDFIRKDMKNLGFPVLYLVTDHTAFYEKCGWEFFAMAKEEEGGVIRMYRVKTNGE